MKQKVLLDTDIGSDIDDAVCLAYLLARPDCDLLGITTVSGQPVERAKIASAICVNAGRDIPIYPGAEQPLTGTQKQIIAHQAGALPRWRHRQDFPSGKAVDFLAETILAYPHEVILCTIGPLTNAARLFQTYPETAEKLKALVMMVGAFTDAVDTGGKGEWNALLDPLATQTIYRTRVKVHRSIGLDVTLQTWLAADQVRSQFSARLLQPVRDFAEIWFMNAQRLTFHDPLAAATIFSQDICAFTRGKVAADAVSYPGLTPFTADPFGAHEVALEVDQEKYFDHFFSTMQAADAA